MSHGMRMYRRWRNRLLWPRSTALPALGLRIHPEREGGRMAWTWMVVGDAESPKTTAVLYRSYQKALCAYWSRKESSAKVQKAAMEAVALRLELTVFSVIIA